MYKSSDPEGLKLPGKVDLLAAAVFPAGPHRVATVLCTLECLLM